MNTLWQDLRYATRTLLKKPWITFVIIAVLALAIGGNTAVFSVVNAVLLRPLPFKDPDALVFAFETEPELPQAPLTGPDYLDWKNSNTVFEAMAAGSEGHANLTSEGDPQRIQAVPVSPGFFEVLGVLPEMGRSFNAGEDQPGRNKVTVLSQALWRSRFGSDPNIIGRRITMDAESYEVVGVMPYQFVFPKIWGIKPDLFVPLNLQLAERPRGTHWLWVMARMKPGVSVEQAQSHMQVIAANLTKEYPGSNQDVGVNIVSMQELSVHNVKTPLLMLFGAIFFVLLITCANVANLLLARTIARQREMGIRIALGASTFRLVRQALTESILLSTLGGLAGLLLAFMAKDIVLKLTPAAYLPWTGRIDLSLGILIFTLTISCLTGLMFGLAPAMQSTRADIQKSLKEGSSNPTGSTRGRLRSILVVAEFALGMILLVGAGLMIRSFQKLLEVSPGFNPQNVLTIRLELPDTKYESPDRQRMFFNSLVERAGALPGVDDAAATSQVPLDGGQNGVVQIEGRPSTEGFGGPLVQPTVILGDYFRVVQIPVLRGRGFTGADAADSPKVVVINQKLAQVFWPNHDPIGKRLAYGKGNNPSWCQVVGIVGDVRQWGLARPPLPEIYFPYSQSPQSIMQVVIRSSTDPDSLAKSVRAQVHELDRELPVAGLTKMTAVIDRWVVVPRFQAWLMGIFGALALLLATVGIYGVMSFTVAQHTREIGIRVALGARRLDVMKLVVGRGLLLTIIGVVLGVAGSLGLTRLLASLLYGVTPLDPLTFVTVTTLLILVALLACLIPARRATKVDPLVALRYE